MENKKHSIKVFDGETEVSNYEGIDNAIAFGTKVDPEDPEKIKILVYHGKVTNQGIFLLTRALLNNYDDALATILMACSSFCADEDDFTEIEGEIESSGFDGDEDGEAETGEETEDSWDK